MTDSEQARLAADWATILQSEWAALAADWEVQEALQRAALHLARQAAALQAGPPRRAPAECGDDAPGPAGADAPARPPALDAAPGAAGAAIGATDAGRLAAARGGAAGLG